MSFSPVQLRPDDAIIAKLQATLAGKFVYAWIGEAIREKAEKEAAKNEPDTNK